MWDRQKLKLITSRTLCIDEPIFGLLTVEADVVIGEDDGSVALGNASHRHMEDAMGSLNVMLLQPQRRRKRTG